MDFERIPSIYDSAIWPLWAAPFAQMLLREVPSEIDQPVLEVFCNAGGLSCALVPRLQGKARLIALDPYQDLMDIAREKLADATRAQRVFFHHDDLFGRFRLPDHLFSFACCNLGLFYVDPPDFMLEEILRTLQPGGFVLMTLPLRGTFVDLFGPATTFLQQIGEEAAAHEIERHEMMYRHPEQAMYLLHKAGFERVHLRRQSFRLVFETATALFSHPFIQKAFLALWEPLLVRMRRDEVVSGLVHLFDMIRERKPIELVVRGGCLRAYKASESGSFSEV